jgi:transaldolase/glucose-6-phosphate isomerase
MLNRIAVHVPDNLRREVEAEIENWKREDKVNRIWERDASIWTGEDESKWLGWLDIIDEELTNVKRYRQFHFDVAAAGFTSILLMGMGGSSLCPEVLGITFGKPDFHILDSTVPAQVKSIESKIDIEKTLFIVASKSGSTLEPNCFKRYFFERVSERVGKENAGRQFVAITDPGSKMEQVSQDDGFRDIFYGKPEIGGRFSALSAFGLTAAAAMGIEVETLLRPAKEMANACKSGDLENTGLLVGAILGVCQRKGLDKLTILTGDRVHDLGAWLEQLIAESTGKNGVAIIPIDREPLVDVTDYGHDRVFVSLVTKDDNISNEQARVIDALKKAGRPVIEIELDSIENIGQEFFRWEFATAVAGSIMQINPFDQPDVESAKVEARKLTDEYERSGSLPEERPFFEENNIRLFADETTASRLIAEGGDNSLASILNSHLSTIRPGDYFALLAYIEMNRENEEMLQSIRRHVLERYRVATCLGFGPRFLHSTGQAYKGGPNTGVYLQITSDDEFDLAVPGQKFTFGIVKAAQARGDLQVLVDRGRRALRVHLGKEVADGLRRLISTVRAA